MKLFSNFVLFSHAIEARKPNVILMITDDFGMGDFRIYNREAKVPTPNVDRLGHEGVNFYGASTASSRCSPSRYMLMTGRYSMEDQEGRIIKEGQPHLGEMFKKAGYTTGLFGKQQPLPNGIKKENRTFEEWLKVEERNQASWKFRHEVGKFNNEMNVFQDFGYYEQADKPQKYDYDYSFTKARLFFLFLKFFSIFNHKFIRRFKLKDIVNESESEKQPSYKPGLCCNPGLYFENGRSTEPAEMWVQQQPFPETTPLETYDEEGYPTHPFTGYYGPAGQMDQMANATELPLYHVTWMRQNIVGKTFDSRNVEQKVSRKVLDFIDENHEEPFFAYYAMHSGHGPFNSAEKFRNQTEAGILGEVIMEADEIVGNILDKLEEHEIADDTLVIFMTDNGPSTVGKRRKRIYGHNQWQLDLPESGDRPGKTIELQDKDQPRLYTI